MFNSFMNIFTIGHSTRSLEEFIDILKQYKIELLVDIRRFPLSKKFPHFDKEFLEQELLKNRIKYLHYPELGGFRKEGYENFVKTNEFTTALFKLLKIIDDKTVALMCSEWNPLACHRWYVSNALYARGYDINHIININKIQNHFELSKKKPKPKCKV